jgi:hypothetical protein
LWSTAACVAAFFACSPAWAQINKCVDARGKVSYQEQPCPGAKIERIVPAARSQPAAPPQPAATPQPVATPQPAAKESDARANCAQTFAEIQRTRASIPNLRPAEQKRLRKALEREESMWKERCG